jgi:TetR/AcrR family transcriptional regulator, repressor for neighboring sulfatase
VSTAPHRPTGRDEILDAVLDAADRLFARSSPTDVSMREIAREADVTYGLVHRHFGTKEELIERLLQRYQQRWIERLDASPGYGEILDYLLGPSAETGAYLRLVAWMLLAGTGAASPDTHRRYVELDRLLSLPGRAGGEHAPTETAAALAFIFGWRFFNPFIRAALPLGETDTESLHEVMRDELRRLQGDASDGNDG